METLHEFMLVTKQQEYLLAISFLFLFLIIWTSLGKSKALPPPVRAFILDNLTPRKKSFYHPGHTWLLPGMFGWKLVGVDDFIDNLAGSLQAVKVPQIGTSVSQGEPLFILDLGVHKMTVFAPISGEITMVNPKMYQQSYHPQLGTSTANWLVRINPSNWENESTDLITSSTAIDWLKSEVSIFRQFLDEESERPTGSNVALADGGEPVMGVLQLLENEGVERFEEVFLHNT